MFSNTFITFSLIANTRYTNTCVALQFLYENDFYHLMAIYLTMLTGFSLLTNYDVMMFMIILNN